MEKEDAYSISIQATELEPVIGSQRWIRADHEMDVKRSSSQDVCRMKASLPLGGWASRACIPGSRLCDAWVPFPAGRSRRHHFSSLGHGQITTLSGSHCPHAKGRLVTSKARCPLFTDGGALFSKVSLH